MGIKFNSEQKTTFVQAKRHIEISFSGLVYQTLWGRAPRMMKESPMKDQLQRIAQAASAEKYESLDTPENREIVKHAWDPIQHPVTYERAKFITTKIIRSPSTGEIEQLEGDSVFEPITYGRSYNPLKEALSLLVA